MKQLFLGSWIVGTAILVCLAGFFGLKLILTKRIGFGTVVLLIGILALFFNPIVNMILTDGWNQRYCEVALQRAKEGNYIGAQSEVIKKSYGPHYRVEAARDSEYWSYRTCPWFILFPDEFLGFEMRDGKVVNVYIQVD